ncbi:MAG TPA: amidohydrolase family protein [bacterium]|nr:amidohydrolase family protein [bacterium]HPN33327.1 amidohydrolase family protein [bacterium]
MFALKGHIVTPDETIDGFVAVKDGRVRQVCAQPPDAVRVIDYGDDWIVPGFIDLHTHGIGSYEPVDEQGLAGMAQEAVRYGTTGLLPTGAAMSVDQYVQLGVSAAQAARSGNGRAARLLGVHLEGPFINPRSSGAMALSTRRPISLSEASIYVERIGAMFKIMTFSPELENGLELIRFLASHGVVASLGHSVANGTQLHAFVEAGLSHVVHLFNAFVPSGEKEPGVLQAGLLEHILVEDALTCELICDLHHVAPEIIKIAARVLGPYRFVAVTDSLYGAGLEDGQYTFPDGAPYRISDGVARLCGGKWAGGLAGSVLTMNRAFGNLVQRCLVDPVLAARYTSTNAARILKIDAETGSIEPGKKADLAVLDADFHCLATYLEGNLVYEKR